MSQQLFSFAHVLSRGSVKRHDRLTFRGNLSHSRHGWLRLTPAYSVHVVEELLDRHSGEQTVLDPFCGTGTTPLVCATRGVACDAVDINPFLVWLASVKAHAFTKDDLEACRGLARSFIHRAPDGDKGWVPPLHEIGKWWDPPILVALARLFARLQAARDSISLPAFDLACIAFCKVMIGSANVSFGHQSMSFRRRRAGSELFCLRIDVQQEFRRIIEELIGDAQGNIPKVTPRILLGDARCLDGLRNSPLYTLVITSPPYPNRMSYIRELRPYMFWLKYLSTGRQAGELDWQAIGGTWGCATSNLSKWQPDPRTVIPFDGFDVMLGRISERSQILATYVRRYFHDMLDHLRALRRVLGPSATCYYVIGNSKFYDVVLPAERIMAALFGSVGFERVAISVLRKRTSKKELFEYVVEAHMPSAARGAIG